MIFTKYHALGNDYLVLHTPTDGALPSADQIKRLCHRHQGVGGDGILLGPLTSDVADFRLRIFNPDASEAEKSGNGLRIFCRYLWDKKLVRETPFCIETLGGIVTAQVFDAGRRVQVNMGRVSFSSESIPVTGVPREVLMEELEIAGQCFRFCAATIGNPHCVIIVEQATEALARQYGPLLEVNPLFPNRTNVQFMQILSRNSIRIEIWERGAGYTLASGSSSCAAASIAHRLGLCGRDITVHMPGGEIDIELDEAFNVAMSGPVTRVCEGRISAECYADT